MEIPFVFPEMCVHLLVANAMTTMLASMFEGAVITPLSAGSLSSTAFDDECYGESESLKLASRGIEDSRLIRTCDYGGIYFC